MTVHQHGTFATHGMGRTDLRGKPILSESDKPKEGDTDSGNPTAPEGAGLTDSTPGADAQAKVDADDITATAAEQQGMSKADDKDAQSDDKAEEKSKADDKDKDAPKKAATKKTAASSKK